MDPIEHIQAFIDANAVIVPDHVVSQVLVDMTSDGIDPYEVNNLFSKYVAKYGSFFLYYGVYGRGNKVTTMFEYVGETAVKKALSGYQVDRVDTVYRVNGKFTENELIRKFVAYDGEPEISNGRLFRTIGTSPGSRTREFAEILMPRIGTECHHCSKCQNVTKWEKVEDLFFSYIRGCVCQNKECGDVCREHMVIPH